MTANDIRNIALLGHGGSGKTSLAEQMLFMTKGVDRLGKTVDGNTTCDYDAEEIKRQISISLAFAPVMYKGKKINVMDAPGNFDFSGEAVCAIRAAECAVIVGNAKDGLSVGMERTWKMLGKKPRMMFINRVEEANSDYASCIEAIKAKYGTAIAPIVATKADANKAVTVIVDLLHNKAYDAKGECAIPGDMADEVEALRAELMEAAAGADEELMEKFFETMELSAEDMAKGLKIGVRDGSVCPVLCGSAVTGMGVDMLMQTIVDLVPVATDMPAEAAEDDDGNPIPISSGGMSYGNEPMIELYAVTQEQYDAVLALIDSTTTFVDYDQNVLDIISDEAAGYFAGSKTVEEASKLIQRRVSLYIQEQK